MNQGTCETCRWWDSEGCGIGYGFCRFNPPTAVFRGEEDGVDIYWPWTKKEDWCSHHTPKPIPATGEKVGPPEHPDFDMRPINETP